MRKVQGGASTLYSVVSKIKKALRARTPFARHCRALPAWHQLLNTKSNETVSHLFGLGQRELNQYRTDDHRLPGTHH